MSSNDNLLDAYTRHQIFVLRYSRGREAEAAKYIQRLADRVIEKLRSGGTEISTARQQAMLLDIAQLITKMHEDYSAGFIQEALDFGNYEAEFNQKLLGRNITASAVLPAPEQIASAVYTNVLSLEPTKGYTIQSMLSEFGRLKSRQVVSYIRDGFTLGETTDQITNRVLSNVDMQKRQAESLVRTSLNHVAIQARQTTMRENSDVIEGYKWLSTLDSRTSLVCASRDGIIYEDVDSNPKPPAHFNCRSTITYVIKPEYDLGRDIKVERPSVGAEGVTQVSENTRYPDWLKRQPPEFQDEVLGKARGRLFREGNITIDKFVDNTGKVLSLDRLRSLEPMAFNSSGI